VRALAAALLLAPGVALADPPRVALDAVGLTFALPAGFEAQRAAAPSPDLLGTWVRAGAAGEGPVVLQFAAVAGALREGTPTADDLAAWRGSDPFAFDDRAEESSWQGLTLHTRAGTATVNGRAMVRVATVLPLARASVRLAVFAPASRGPEARDAFRAALASARGEAAWRTPGERLRSRALLGVVLAALLGMLAYGALALAVFRKRDGWRPARAAALFTIAAAQDVALAAVFAHRGWTLRRRA